MTKFKMVAVMATAVATSASVARAQCTSGGAQDACQKTVDAINFITPQLATALTGGSATLGQGGTHAGLGHFALDLRATGVFGSIPKFSSLTFNTTSAQPTKDIASGAKIVPGFTAGASIGLYRGFSLGVTHIGGVDALISATYIPNVDVGGVSVKAKGSNYSIGYGVRIGLLEESLVAPGVAFTILRRELPTVSIVATGSNGKGTLNDFSVSSTAWRLTASKSFLLLNLYGGLGQDRYSSSSTVIATVGSATSTSPLSLSTQRTNIFIGTSLNLLVLKITGELGQAHGGNASSATNTFGSAAKTTRNYASLGVRFAL